MASQAALRGVLKPLSYIRYNHGGRGRYATWISPALRIQPVASYRGLGATKSVVQACLTAVLATSQAEDGSIHENSTKWPRMFLRRALAGKRYASTTQLSALVLSSYPPQRGTGSMKYALSLMRFRNRLQPPLLCLYDLLLLAERGQLQHCR